MSSSWLVNDLFPAHHKIMDAAIEGSFKTTFGCWLSVMIASGSSVFGHLVRQGPVIVADEETPVEDLERALDRFSQGVGYQTYKDLPITVESLKGFRFGRKTERDRLIEKITRIQPVFIRMDSLIAMLPRSSQGRQSLNENSDAFGETIRDDLNDILGVSDCSVLLSAHCKKRVAEFTLQEMVKADMITIVRGHGSIVGEGCDTGIAIYPLSRWPNPTRFVLVFKPRRRPITADLIYIEMIEQQYGSGPAWLAEVSPTVLPASYRAKKLYQWFSSVSIVSNWQKSAVILKEFSFYNRKECLEGVLDLVSHEVLYEGKGQAYVLNPNWEKRVSREYADSLKS